MCLPIIHASSAMGSYHISSLWWAGAMPSPWVFQAPSLYVLCFARHDLYLAVLCSFSCCQIRFTPLVQWCVILSIHITCHFQLLFWDTYLCFVLAIDRYNRTSLTYHTIDMKLLPLIFTHTHTQQMNNKLFEAFSGSNFIEIKIPLPWILHKTINRRKIDFLSTQTNSHSLFL